MRYILLACLTLSLGLAACGPSAPFDVGGDPSPGDSASAADASSGREDVAAAVSGTSCLNRCDGYNAKATCQCDDKCVANGDCCGDYIKQCLVEVKPAADAGSSSPDVVQTNCVDSDGDGYCDSAPKQGDCNDKDKNINPGASEKCAPDGTGNGVDENCNNQIDEGCKAASNPAPTGNNTLTVTYPDSAYRRLSYGITPDTSFTDWKPQAWTMNSSLTVDLGNPQQDNCFYLRFNVDQPQGWLCMGNTTAVLNSQATITATLFGQTYNTSNVKKVFKDGGCSGYFLVAKPGASCPTP